MSLFAASPLDVTASSTLARPDPTAGVVLFTRTEEAPMDNATLTSSGSDWERLHGWGGRTYGRGWNDALAAPSTTEATELFRTQDYLLAVLAVAHALWSSFAATISIAFHSRGRPGSQPQEGHLEP